jgi:hypothetical protein
MGQTKPPYCASSAWDRVRTIGLSIDRLHPDPVAGLGVDHVNRIVVRIRVLARFAGRFRLNVLSDA